MEKKFYLAAAMAAVAITACTNDEYYGAEENVPSQATEITFAGKKGAVTRATLKETQAADSLGKNFVVVGYKTVSGTVTTVFDHYNVNYKSDSTNTTLSNTNGWEYVGQAMTVKSGNSEAANKLSTSASAQTIKYWDYSASAYDFLAFSVGNGVKASTSKTYATPSKVTTSTGVSSATYTLTGTAEQLGACYVSDLKNVTSINYASAVELNFRHLTPKIRMALYETVPGYKVTGVKFYTQDTQSDSSTSNVYPTLFCDNANSAFGTAGTYTITFSNNTAVGTLATSAYSKDLTFPRDISALYLGETTATATYCGNGDDGKGYITVLPNSASSSAPTDATPVTLKVDYTLVSTDGSGEKITVKGAKATIPAAYTAWKAAYAYTYIFKISQNTNGSTGGSSVGLTAITFDAVVVEDEVQETITTVATPSITTYGIKSGAVSVNGDEYAAGTDIYASVQTGTETVTLVVTSESPNVKLYTIKGTDLDINESTVANAIANKTKTPLEATEVKLTTDNIVTTVPTASGTLTISALKWTAAEGKTYAVEYTADSKKYYKVVKTKVN